MGQAARVAKFNPERTHVLAVAIEGYDYEGFNIKGPAAGLFKLTHWLHDTKKIPLVNFHICLSAMVSPLESKDWWQRFGAQICESARRDDLKKITGELSALDGEMLLIYWCGHGGSHRDYGRFLYLQDAKRGDFNILRVSMLEEYGASASAGKFQHLSLVIDACANCTTDDATEGALLPLSLAHKPLKPPRRKSSLYAVPDNQTATVDPEAQMGVFTNALLKAIQSDESFPQITTDLAKAIAAQYEKDKKPQAELPVYKIDCSPDRESQFSLTAGVTLIRGYLEKFSQDRQKELVNATLTLQARNTLQAVTLAAPEDEPIRLPPSLLRTNAARLFDTFSEAYKAQGERILLLGEPGAGKTTTLLQFALDAAQEWLQPGMATDLPIPVLRSVASAPRWDSQTPLKEWVLSHNNHKGIGLEERRRLYIFDGLDELGGERPVDPQQPEGAKYDPRLQFLRAVAEQLPDEQVVISCRKVDYLQLSEKTGEKAVLRGAVTLLPLEPKQVQDFLERQKQHNLWEALVADERLLELARTPLFLSLLSWAEETGEVRLAASTASGIFDFYINRRFEHESFGLTRALPFDKETTRSHLGRIASRMCDSLVPNTVLHNRVGELLLGEQWASFVGFMSSMNILRQASKSSVQFIHLKFRDFCAVPALIEALRDGSEAKRASAARALGHIGDAASVPALIEALRDEVFNVRKQAAIALGEIGDAARPALIEALHGPYDEVGEHAAFALGQSVHHD